jgi:hypothetical protein
MAPGNSPVNAKSEVGVFMNAKHVAESRKGYWRRILRPLYWWLLLVLVLYGIRLHQRLIEQTRITFAITLQNSSALDVATLLDGMPVMSGMKISLGKHTFTVRHPKAESVTKEFFAWYGPMELGQIQLRRCVGNINLQANPPAANVTVTGPEFSTTLHNLAATNLTVPTDDYVIHAEYPHWSQMQNVSVSPNQSSRCTFAPRLGAVRITCNKNITAYRLQFADGTLADRGTLPYTITDLPVGTYQLSVQYHNQQIQKSVPVEASVTNETAIQFLLGAVHIESEPSGADVQDAEGNSLGQTPLDIADLKPQTAQFNLSLDGYQSVSFPLVITADQTNSCRTNLVSLRYLSAIKDARQFMVSQNYSSAVQAAAEALAVYPNDAEALQLQTQANAAIKTEQDRQRRLNRPKVVFDAVCASNPDSNLFDEHELKTRKPVKETVDAIVGALKLEPDSFKITGNDSSEPEIYQIVARQTFLLGILGGSERICILVVGQAKDDETQIWFKVLEYQVQHTIESDGLFKLNDNKQIIPLHSSRMEMNDIYRQRVREGVKLVFDRIKMALR